MTADLTEPQWKLIQLLLPPPKPTGRPRADDRRTLNAILFVLRAGCRWEDLPERYGNHVTAWRRHRTWTEDGTWERLWRTFLAHLDAQDQVAWEQVLLDGTFVPAKKRAAMSA